MTDVWQPPAPATAKPPSRTLRLQWSVDPESLAKALQHRSHRVLMGPRRMLAWAICGGGMIIGGLAIVRVAFGAPGILEGVFCGLCYFAGVVAYHFVFARYSAPQLMDLLDLAPSTPIGLTVRAGELELSGVPAIQGVASDAIVGHRWGEGWICIQMLGLLLPVDTSQLAPEDTAALIRWLRASPPGQLEMPERGADSIVVKHSALITLIYNSYMLQASSNRWWLALVFVVALIFEAVPFLGAVVGGWLLGSLGLATWHAARASRVPFVLTAGQEGLVDQGPLGWSMTPWKLIQGVWEIPGTGVLIILQGRRYYGFDHTAEGDVHAFLRLVRERVAGR